MGVNGASDTTRPTKARSAERHRARGLALQALCQLDAQGDEFATQLDDFFEDESPPADVRAFASQLARQTWQHRAAIDERIAQTSEHWDLSRMAVVDRNVLRMAVYELTAHAETPAAVVINEAVKLAHEFSTADAGGFVNGVLDAVRKSIAANARPGNTEGDGSSVPD